MGTPNGRSPAWRVIVAAVKGGKDPTGESGLKKLKDVDRRSSRASSPLAKQFLKADDPLIEALGLKDSRPRRRSIASWRASSSTTSFAPSSEGRTRGGREVERPARRRRSARRSRPSRRCRRASRRRSRQSRRQPPDRRRGPVQGLRQDAVPGRHVHAAAVVRHREGLRGRDGERSATRRRSAGLYERNAGVRQQAARSTCPQRWLEQAEGLDSKTPLNFVCTADIIGGNSGSPVINRDAEVVGLIFDGNIESLPGNYWYDENRNRAVGVHSAGIIEALQKVYGETELAKELTGS